MKSERFHNLDHVIELLEPHLAEYLSMRLGKKIGVGMHFSCINPAHPDKHPSSNIIPGNIRLFHCFSCGSIGSIFTAAHFLEGKPLRGPGFISDNVCYLAGLFGIEVPKVELTPDEQHDLDTYRATNDASQLIVVSPKSDMLAAKLNQYGWNEATLRTQGVGGVKSFEYYMEQMTKTYGWDRSFLHNVDLDNKKIFNEKNLIFTVRDEHGQPVGFAARNLEFDRYLALYKHAVKQFGVDSQAAKEAKDKVPRSKFVNTSGRDLDTDSSETGLKNRIYQKSTRLYALHTALRSTPPLYVFEGYADATTAFNAGLHNACAVGSTSFSAEHLNLLLDQGVSHMIFTLDADIAGKKGTDHFINIVKERFGDRVGLKIEIIDMPEGSDDPDKFIRERGLTPFLELPRTDLFTWQLKRLVEKGADPLKVIEETLPTIINEANHLLRLKQAERLADATGQPRDAVWGEVQRRVDLEGTRINEEICSLSQRMVKMLERKPEQLAYIMETSQRDLERIEARKMVYDPEVCERYISQILEDAENRVELAGLKTGWPLFDQKFGGVPEGDAFITIPGKPNQGKSSLMANMAWRLAENNDDAMVIYHTIDDSMRWFLPRVLGSRYRIPSQYFERAGYWLRENPTIRSPFGDAPFRQIYTEALAWRKQLADAGRLLIFDSTMLDENLYSLEQRVRALRKLYPSRPMVVFGDNFHLYQQPSQKDEQEAKATRALSMAVKRICNVYHATAIMSMELPKSALEPGQRPRMMNIKGTAGVSYDSSANMGVYNDQKDFRDGAVLTWDETLEVPEEIAPGQIVTQVKRPVLEIVFDKSKINAGFDGDIYYALHPPSGQVLEFDAASQERYRKKAIRAAEERQEAKKNKQSGRRNSRNDGPQYDSTPYQLPQMMVAEEAFTVSEAA